MTTGRLPSIEGGIQPTIVDAKGDIIAATAADTVSKLSVGANDTVLTADSSTATGLKWAAVAGGGLTLLSTTTLSGISTVISSINQSYVGLLAIITNVNVNTATSLTIELDSFSGGVNLMRMISGASVTSTGDLRTNANLPTSTQTTDSYFYLYLPNYNTTDTGKLVDFWCSVNGAPIESLRGGFERTSAIDSLKFDTTNGTSTFSNGTVKLYGVK